jgi:hypothetical protein
MIEQEEDRKRREREAAMEAQRDATAEAQRLTNKVHSEIVAALRDTLPVDPGPITDMSPNASVNSFGMQTQRGFGVQFRIKTAYRPGAQPEITARAHYNGQKKDLVVRYAPDGKYDALVALVTEAATFLARQ